ncbi:MAG: crossover junction endodeoxyribonuclease RuvC [Pedosphaera sp.]|nr:crossover junction endodeoxyribonuclease RuvC [Pedosphaera sp.]MSU44166.1 crossover junction endodeoxyribonuclease RuvC [Pedosphaera sp.]
MGISSSQFSQLQKRLARRKASPAAVQTPSVAVRAEHVVLGVDPSLRGTGYGVIHIKGAQTTVLAQGTIECAADWERTRCLAHIAVTLRQVIERCRPAVAVVEGLFFAQNFKTALIMGEARGAALAVLGEAGLDVYEMAPRRVKQAVVGYGHAQKLAVAKMVQRLLNMPEMPAPDAADALALTLAWAQEQNGFAINPPKKI